MFKYNFSVSRRAWQLVLIATLLFVMLLGSTANALTTANGDYEAETASFDISGRGVVFSDSKASGGKAVNIYSNGYITKTTKTPAVTQITVTARGQVCNGSPIYVLKVDNKQVATATVSATSYTAYKSGVSIAAGTHKVDVVFTNDYSTKCDRNLIIDKVEFTPGSTTPTPPPPTPTPTPTPVPTPTPTPPPAPVLTFAANPTTIDSGSASTLTWSATNVTSCTASGVWSGSKATSGSASTGNLTITSTYTLSCTGSGGTTSGSVTVTVNAPPPVVSDVISDTSASGGKALRLNINAIASKTTITKASTALTVFAKGDQCNGAPTMLVKIDGQTVATFTVSATAYTPYAASTNITAASHKIDVQYSGDTSTTTCDRNLIVDKVEFTAVPTTPTPPPPTPTPTPTPTATILRKVDFETTTNPYPGWDAVFNSGIANTVRSTVQHHTGSYSGAATIDTSTGGESDGTRNTMVTTTTNGQGILPDDAYYSVWYYFPQVITPQEYWNVFQFKRKNAAQTDTLPMYTVNVGRRGGTTGNMYFYLWRHVGNDNGYNTAGSDKAADAPVGIDIPLNTWIHFETHYVFGKNHNGRITSWVNGQQLWDFPNVTTEYDWGNPPNPRHWTVNSYSSKTTPDKHTIYIDDAAISTGRLGE